MKIKKVRNNLKNHKNNQNLHNKKKFKFPKNKESLFLDSDAKLNIFKIGIPHLPHLKFIMISE